MRYFTYIKYPELTENDVVIPGIGTLEVENGLFQKLSMFPNDIQYIVTSFIWYINDLKNFLNLQEMT